MSKPKRRRRWPAEQKLKIVLETLQSDRKLAEICRREGISPTQVYQWRRQLSASAEVVFGRKQACGENRRIAKPASENQRMKNVVAEITAENLDLKKLRRQNWLEATSTPSSTVVFGWVAFPASQRGFVGDFGHVRPKCSAIIHRI